MDLSDLIGVDDVVIGQPGRDKAELLAELAGRAAERLAAGEATGHAAMASASTRVTVPTARDILASLSARERMGSTGLGRGFALPHARIEGLGRLFGLFARLAQPIDFDAIDGEPVDLVFLLLIPGGSRDHVSALAAIARTMRDEATLRQVRKAGSAAILHRHLTSAASRGAEPA